MKALYGEALERKVIKEQCKKGKRIGEVILGEEWLIHRYFFRHPILRIRISGVPICVLR